MRISVTNNLLNPMLVRDLRQFLRSRVFTLVFLLLQGGMAFFVVLGLSSTQESEVSGLLNTILWGGLTIFYFMLLPAIALSSLTPEFSDSRLDLLKLTQMSARGLMVGKWLSFCAQGALVAVSLLPYLVLSYYSGGVELGSELASMGWMLASSSLLIGLCLAISSMNSRVIRGVLILMFIFGFFGGFSVFMSAPRGVFTSFSMPSAGAGSVVAMAILGIIGAAAWWLCIEFGAARLAPSAENHDTPQRLLLPVLCFFAIGIMVVAVSQPTTGLFALLRPALEVTFVIPLALIIWILVQAMATDPSPYPDTYRVYMRGGVWRRWLGRLALYPGWPSAVFLITGLTMLFLGLGDLLLLYKHSDNAFNYLLFCLVVPSGLMFPQLAGELLRRTRLTSGNRYLFILGSCLIVMIGCILFANTWHNYTQQSFLAFACLLPPDALLLFPAVDWEMPEHGYAIAAAILTGVPTLIIGIMRAVQYWPKFAELERRAAQLNRAENLTAAPLADVPAAAASDKPPASDQPNG